MFQLWHSLPEPRNFTPSKALRRRWRFWSDHIWNSPTFRLLQCIEFACTDFDSETSGNSRTHMWLLPFRGELRKLLAGFDSRCNNGEVDVVRYYWLTCPRHMIAICVWLVGRFSDRTHLYEIKTFRHDESPQVRKHVAKALRRLEAWSLLREMAATYPDDERIRWFATAPTSQRPFAERLKNFTTNVDDSHAGEVATPSAMPFWALECDWTRTPPKSVLTIRRILQRIRHWVRWGVS